MDQRVFLKLENGEIVSLEDGGVPGTSYVVQDEAVASTSYVVQGEGLADNDYIVQEGSSPRTSYVLQNGVIAKTSHLEHDSNTHTSGSGEATAVNGVAVEDDGAQNVVYIVQQDGGDTENMQYAVIGEAGSIGSAYAIQAVEYSNKKPPENEDLTQMQDMSGIETLSRVAAQEFAGSVIHKNAENKKNEIWKRINTDKNAKNKKFESDSVKICFSCQHCGDEYEDLSDFKLHVKNVHGLDDIDGESEGENELTLYPSCQVCSQTFADVQDLEAHKKIHSEEFVSLLGISKKKGELDNKAGIKTKEIFKCRSCQASFGDRNSLIKHISSEHSKSASEEGSSSSFTKCPYCHKMYVQRGSNKSMIKHIYSAHPGKSVEAVSGPGNKEDKLEEKVNCFACGLGFYWHKSLIRHIKDRHPKLLEEKGDQIFAELGIQDLQSPSVKLRRSTKDGSHSGELLNCQNCPKKFLWEKSLRRHMLFYHKLGVKTAKRVKKVPVVYCCPHCSLVSKYACAVRKHMERKHSELIKGIDVTTLQLPTMEAEAATDIELKTIDKRPAEVRLNFCPVIFRCPFCTYATKQGSNLIRHLTSVKHGNIFTNEELKKIGITSFRVKQELMKFDDTEKLDGTSSHKLGKLKLKGRLLDIVMKKFEILRNRKQENKENGLVAAEDEEDFGEMDIDNIIDMAEDESEESFNEDDDDDDDIKLESENEKEIVSRNSSKERKNRERIYRSRKEKERNSGKCTLEKTANDETDKMIESCKDQAINDKTEIKLKKEQKGMSPRKKNDNGTLDIEVLNNDPDEIAVCDVGSSDGGTGIKQTDSNNYKNVKKLSSKQVQIKKDGLPRKPDGTELKFRDSDLISKKVMLVDKSRISQTTEMISANLNTQGSLNVENEKTDSQVCEVCKKTFNDFTAFKQHLSSHINIRVFFRCVECGCEIPFLKDLKNHLLKEHGQKYPESSIASLHTNVVKMDSKPVNAYDCPYCEMLFSQSNTLQQHVVMDHMDNIQSASIKQENTDSPRHSVPETVVSAFNCKFCECFYYNIKDMVKHMYVVHRDVDKSDCSENSISVRKSGRKRKLPKWLEETTDDISKTKKLKHLNDVNDSPVLKRKEKNMEVPQEKGRGQKERNKDSDTSNSDKLENQSRSKKTNREVNPRVTSETDKKDISLKLPDSENDIKHLKKAVKTPVSARKTAVAFDLPDKTEIQNKCPHCDFTAKRSSALSFHINFKHANERGTDPGDNEKQESGKQSYDSSPKKLKTKGSAEMSTVSSIKKSKTVVSPTETSAFAAVEDQLCIKNDTVIESNENKHSGSLFDIKSKNIIQGTSKPSKEVEDNEMEAENEFSDFDIEFGDSDDDYRPERDEDSSSDIGESDDENSVSKGNISINLKCPYCQKGNFSNFSLLESHVNEQHPKQAKSFSIADVKTEVEIDGTVSWSDLVYSCKYCDKRFLSKSHVRTHMKNRHRKKLHAKRKRDEERNKKSDEVLYKCKFCDVVASSVERIITHINRQHPENDISNDEIQKCMYVQTREEILQDLFKCPYCETKSRWKQAILRHMGHSHPGVAESEYDEIICEREIVRYRQQKKYQCVYCNWQYDRKEDVLTHLFDTHPDQPSVTEDDVFEVEISVNVEDHFQCPYCSLQSKYKRCIIRHVGRAHKDKKGFTKSDVICLSTKKSRSSVTEGLVFMCPFCDFDSRWKQCIIRHVDSSHPEMKDFDPETIASEQRRKSVVNLDETHPMDDENDAEYFKCSFCDAVSETKDGVLAHTYKSHPKKSDFTLNQVEKAVWNGMVTSDEDVVYKCPVCECGSKWKKRVVLHVKREHPEVKKFHVELCKADFMRGESELGTVYICKLCNEILTSTRGVTAHALQVHGKEEQIVVETISAEQKLTNIFKCMYCEHRSALRSAIMKHVEIHHPVVDNFQPKDVICETVQEGDLDGKGGYQCPYCDTVNHWKKSIVRHVKTVHPYERHDIEIHFNPAVSVKGGGRSSRKSSKEINCLRCGTTCRSIEKMRKHFKTKHSKLVKNFLNKENTEFSYQAFAGRPLDHVCVLCSARYMWKKSLLVHVKNQHRDMFQVYQTLDNVVDIVASAAGPETSASQQSEVERPNVIKETVVSEPGRCGQCKLIFKTKWAASVHKRLKHGKHSKRRIHCSKCSLSFSRRSLYLHHKIRYHRGQRQAATLNCSVPGCNFRCKFSKMLQNHYRKLHNLNIPWSSSAAFIKYSLSTSKSCRCEICMKTFSSALQLKQHVELHKKQRRIRFQCGTCGEQFLTRTLRDSHIETFHLDKAEMCDICGALFAKSNMRKHMKAHEEESSEETECPYCQKVLTARMFNRHMLYEHQDILNCQCPVCLSGEEDSDQVGHTCLVCKKSFCQQAMLFVHSKLQHADKKTKFFYCEACPDLYFLTKKMRDIHCHEHHRKKPATVPKQSASVSRSTSTYTSNDPTTHVIHIGQDEGRQYLPKLSESSMNAVIKELLVFEKGVENPYKCLLCGRSFSKSKYIKLHIRRAHVRDEDQPYRCKVCGSGFVRLTEFRKHSRSHSDFRPYKCRYCDKAFKQQANLRDHYRVHTNTKEYECFICKTEFRQRGGLTSHVVFHDTLKPFQCMYCQKGFTTRGELSRHMQKYSKDITQTAEKNYPCHICEESFPHYPMLLKHIDAHNPEKPFQCAACKEKFANYVAMYFHKVKNEHFLLEEIQEGMKDLQKRGRKFRAKKSSSKVPGPEIVYASNQPVTETIYISQPDGNAENEAGIKPVEIIIEEFGQDQIVRVQENEPEHEELLSIAKQLTELSGFHGSEYFTNKKNAHQEEDEIIKNMLDADEDVLANLSKQGAGNKSYDDERDSTKNFERTEQKEMSKDVVEENYEYMPEIENDIQAINEPSASSEDYSYASETSGQIQISASSVPTNMEELVTLVSQNSSVNNSDKVMAYQSEDGSVIYVCLPDDRTEKTEEVATEEITGESDIIEDMPEAAVQETDESDFNMECTETVEELDDEHSSSVIVADQIAESTMAVGEEQAIESNGVDIVHIPASQEIEPLNEIQQNEETDVQAEQTENAEEEILNKGEQGVPRTDLQPLKTSVIQMSQFITAEQVIPVTSEQKTVTATHLEESVVKEIQNQDYKIVEPKFENSIITIQPQDTLTEVMPESHEDLIQRSHLARHLTGNIQPREETHRLQTHLIVTEHGLQNMNRFEPLVSQEVTQGENITQSLITIAPTAVNSTHVLEDSVASNTNFEQVAVTRQEDSFVEGEETLVEYQIDESRFIKEELLDADYSAMSEKDREVMFFSDNIYTYSQLEKKFICLHCGVKIGSFKNLKNHIRRHAPKSARTHVCTYCSKRFVTKNELKRHLYTHTGERNYECKECGKKFIQPGHLQEHLRLHTGQKPFQCSDCAAAFITKSQLVLHYSRLHSNNEIPCPKCDKVFKSHIDLRRHKGLEHSGSKESTQVVKAEVGEHVCDICGQSFNKKATLKRHLEKHNLENLDESEKVQERFACEVCGISFKSKYYVKEHFKMVHSQEKNEICELCGMGFKTKTMLKRHKFCKHPEDESNRKWHCDICNKSLGSKCAYGYHMGSKHPNVCSDQ